MKVIGNIILPYLIFLALCIFLVSCLGNMALASIDESVTGTSIIVVLFVFGLLVVYMKLTNNLTTWIYEKSTTWLHVLLLYIYLNSVLYSIIDPFTSRNLYITMLLPALGYCFVKTYIMKTDDLNKVLYPFLIVEGVMVYYYYVNSSELSLLVDYMAANNSSYFVLFFLPFVLCLNNKYVKCLFVVIIIVCVVSSFKRGGVIALAFALFVHFVVDKYVKQRDTIFFVVIPLILLYSLLFYYFSYSNNEIIIHLMDRFDNISEDRGSGREEIYQIVYEKFCSSNPIEMIFGHGWNAVFRVSKDGLSAHNDFLECLFDFGIIGLFLYARLYIGLYKKLKELIDKRSSFAAPFSSSIALLFVTSCIGHVIIYIYYLMIFVMFWSFSINSSKKYGI